MEKGFLTPARELIPEDVEKTVSQEKTKYKMEETGMRYRSVLISGKYTENRASVELTVILIGGWVWWKVGQEVLKKE